MAKKDGGYPMKSPRNRTHGLAARAIDQVEDGIYIVVAVLLVVAGVFALWGALTKLVSDVQQHHAAVTVVTDLLDNGLILFIIAELLHTVRVTIQERTLVVEPFLIVALIAGVRRLLLVTAQLATNSAEFTWGQQGIEMTVLLALILGITVALVLWHRFHIQSVAGKA
ncbi:MAG TPA: phosphate-starvation-inducible PsiE family protein [Candidatus Acidoferrum sp.]|jgi:uncharacterized membrane protein (DUF373 family)|nr:phosphate-starvation-inducible PsiE family protein [Candidatus Acidoferrum sp.]